MRPEGVGHRAETECDGVRGAVAGRGARIVGRDRYIRHLKLHGFLGPVASEYPVQRGGLGAPAVHDQVEQLRRHPAEPEGDDDGVDRRAAGCRTAGPGVRRDLRAPGVGVQLYPARVVLLGASALDAIDPEVVVNDHGSPLRSGCPTVALGAAPNKGWAPGTGWARGRAETIPRCPPRVRAGRLRGTLGHRPGVRSPWPGACRSCW